MGAAALVGDDLIGHLTSYSYDPAGNVRTRTYPDGTAITYTPDDDERLASVTTGGATTSYTYDPSGNLKTTVFPDSYTETRSYDNANRLTGITTAAGHTTLSTFTYTLDGAGNPTAVTGTNPALYSYDSRDRLTSVCFQTRACTKTSDPYIAWTYDPVGNRKTETRGVGGTTTTSTYNEADQLLSAGTTGYGYDHNGNQTQAGTRTYSYDAANRLTATTNGTNTDNYSYDGDGNRLTAAATVSGTTTTTNYLWDSNNDLPQLALEKDSANNLIRRYTTGNDTIGYTTPAGSFYYHYDGIGSVINVTNAAGVTQWTYSYEPYGNARTTTQNATGAPANPLRFTGEYQDADTGLYNLRARQYDPASGRFLGTDPIIAAKTTPYSSTYIYAQDDPTRFTDPSGTCSSKRAHSWSWHAFSPPCFIKALREDFMGKNPKFTTVLIVELSFADPVAALGTRVEGASNAVYAATETSTAAAIVREAAIAAGRAEESVPPWAPTWLRNALRAYGATKGAVNAAADRIGEPSLIKAAKVLKSHRWPDNFP